MHEDRQQNAFAALDILARADSTAFAAGRNDAYGANRPAAHYSGKTAEAGLRERRTNASEDTRSLATLQAEKERLENETSAKYPKGPWPSSIIKKIDALRYQIDFKKEIRRNDDVARLPAHEKYRGHMIDTSYTKGKDGAAADYYVVSALTGPLNSRKFPTLAAAKAAIDNNA